MSSLFVALFALVTSSFRSRVALQAEILALRHQLAVFHKNAPRRFAPPAVRPAFVGLAVTMVARLAPESTHRSPRYSDRLAP
jgi:hypothetical protein